MGLLDEVRFPCDSLPEETRQLRLLGIYSQRQKGLVLQRIKIPGGRIRLEQLRGLAMSARQYTPGYPLHVTTRQDVELHGIEPAKIPAVQSHVAGLGLTCVGAAGDTPRNIVVCPHDGFHRGTWRVGGLAEAIQASIESLAWIADLPRKFKISVCGCGRACTRPWIQDIGLVAGAGETFSFIAAGSLGAKPGSGILLYDTLRADEIIPLVHATLRLFYTEGDRVNRQRARLRHVRERLGDEEFARRIESLRQEETSQRQFPTPPVIPVEKSTPLQSRLALPLGDIFPEDAERLAAAVEAVGGEMRIGLDHDLLVFGETAPELGPALAELAKDVYIVACPGTTWCTRGVVDSRGAAERIRQRLPGDCRVSIAVSGCPNNCSQAAAAHIGLVGRVKVIDGERVDGFRVFIGGTKGKTPVLGSLACEFVPADEVDEFIASLLKENGHMNYEG